MSYKLQEITTHNVEGEIVRSVQKRERKNKEFVKFSHNSFELLGSYVILTETSKHFDGIIH